MNNRSQIPAYHALWMIVAASIVVIDRITKVLALIYLPVKQAVPVNSFFNFFLVANSGAAFSFGSGNNWFFTLASVIISILVIFQLVNSDDDKSIWHLSGFALILGGAIGNLYDRIALRFVIDFVDLHINEWHWPAFNIADSAIVVGVLLLVVTYKQFND